MINEKYYVGYSEVDKNYKLTNVALLRIFQNIVNTHANSVGDGVRNNAHAWFLISYKIKIIKRPEMDTCFNLSTWSRGIKGFLASREFESRDESGNLQLC